MSAAVPTAARMWYQPAPPNAAAVMPITAATVRIMKPNSVVKSIGQTARTNAKPAKLKQNAIPDFTKAPTN